MQNDTIQVRTAVQMFIDFLWEHREVLQAAIEESQTGEGNTSATQLASSLDSSSSLTGTLGSSGIINLSKSDL